MGLPCTDPIPISVEVNISELLHRLESIQGSRVADLLFALSRLFHDQGLNPAGGSESGGLGSDPSQTDSGGGNSLDKKGKGRMIDERANDHQRE